MQLQDFFYPQPVLNFLNMSMFGHGIIDFWLAYHFVAAILGYIILKLCKVPTKVALWIVGIGIFVVEAYERYLMGSGIILQEPILNTILDIIVGFAGLWVIWYFGKNR